MLNELECIGLDSPGLPEELGGTWTEADRAQWHTQRSELESTRREEFGDLQMCREDSLEGLDKMAAVSASVAATERGSAGVVGGRQSWQTDNVMVQFQRALEAIPNEEKADYILAREQVPDLVAKETPAIRFLKVEKYNAVAAARRAFGRSEPN